MQKYSYKRELEGVTNSWHKLELPNDIFKKISPDLSDIRVFGISEKNDTIEAPYLLELKREKRVKTNVNFKIINTSHNEKGYYFTLEVPNQDVINQLQIDFKQFNFDWRISLEGSNNQNEWFTIVDDYRILSIKNAETFYEYNNITFPNSSYNYFRILVKSLEKPELKSVKASYTTIEKGEFYGCEIKSLEIEEKKQEKSSDINIELSKRLPVSYLKIDVDASYDYYRPIMIKYVSDSVKTQNGYVYNYRTLTNGTLNSIENNVFAFENTVLKKLKIIVNNQDNEPLKIENVTVKGNVYNLDIRFTEPATYFLTYGNSNVYRPNYDIERFVSKTPDTISSLTLGEEQVIYKKPTSNNAPLFQNKIWLWIIIVLMVALLGWFSIKMMKSK
ncbi:DUF3999 family protein [Gaetbulibacter sp. M235]|uniref:DUF3999 family protein n=1 Tax=Gaetbulibacter sp. M235 TaxID=3126510 RepID=UPI00374F4337